MVTSTRQCKTIQYKYGTYFNSGSNNITSTTDDVSWSDTRTPEANNPRYRAQIRAHTNAGTEMGSARQTFSRGSCDAWCTWGPTQPYNKTIVTGEALGSPAFPLTAQVPPSGSVMLCEALASQKLLLKARQAQTQLQSLVSAGEFGETVRMLRNPAKALFSSIRDYMSVARRRAARVKKKHQRRVIRDTWLEYRLGWLPLASDIEGAYDALHDLPTARFKKIRASHSVDSSGSVSDGVSSIGIFPFRYTETDVRSVSTYAYGEVRVDCTTPQGSLARFGLRTSEFLPTVWELIPYSFVVDYFSNIGDAIAAATFPVSNMSWSGMTSRSRTIRTRSYTLSRVGVQGNQSSFKDCGGSCSKSTSERTVLSRSTAVYHSLSVFKLQFEIPGLSLKWLNLAALKR